MSDQIYVYLDMISGRGISSVDAGRLAVTAPLQRLRAARSRRSRSRSKRRGEGRTGVEGPGGGREGGAAG